MLLTIKQLQVKYGKQTALQINSPISFEKGERIGVIGANGEIGRASCRERV